MLASPQLSMPDHAPGLFSHYHAQINGLPSPLTPQTQPEHNIYSALFASSFDTHRFLSEAQFSPKPQPAAVQPRKQYKPAPQPQMRFPAAKQTTQRKKSSPPPCTKPGSRDRFEALNVHPLFKSRLCRHYTTRGFCAYGEMCRFAHGRQDLRHKGQTIEDYARRTGRDPVELFKALAKEAPQMQRQQDGTIRAVSKVGGTQTVVKAVTKPKNAKPAQRVTVAEVRRARRHSVDLERIYQRQQKQQQQRQHKSCPTVPRRLNQHQLGLLQDELRQSSPQHQPIMSRANSVDSELDEIAEQLRQLDMVVVG